MEERADITLLTPTPDELLLLSFICVLKVQLLADACAGSPLIWTEDSLNKMLCMLKQLLFYVTWKSDFMLEGKSLRTANRHLCMLFYGFKRQSNIYTNCLNFMLMLICGITVLPQRCLTDRGFHSVILRPLYKESTGLTASANLYPHQ